MNSTDSVDVGIVTSYTKELVTTGGVYTYPDGDGKETIKRILRIAYKKPGGVRIGIICPPELIAKRPEIHKVFHNIKEGSTIVVFFDDKHEVTSAMLAVEGDAALKKTGDQ